MVRKRIGGCKDWNQFCSLIQISPPHSINKLGSYYIGEFKGGLINGQGTFCWPDGKKYVGEWKQAKHHGKGIEYSADGHIFREGVWADDKYVGKG